MLYTYLRQLFFSFIRVIAQKKITLIKVVLPFIVVLFGYAACSYSQYVVKSNIQGIFAISDAIRTYYADKPGFWLLNTEYAIKQGIIPTDYIKNDSIQLRNNINVLVGSGINGDTVMPLAQSFDVVLPNLNKAQCISYAESDLTEAQKIKVIRISIINAQGTYDFEWGGEKSLPISKFATKKLCLDKGNTIIWSLK